MKTSPSLLLCLLAALLVFAFPFVSAQQSIRVQVVSVGSGVAGGQEPISVTAMVYYNGTTPNYPLRIGILDAESSPQQVVPGIVTSSTDTCMEPESAIALCTIPTHAASGVDRITFQIGGIFGGRRMPGVWKLDLIAALFDSNGTVVPNSTSSSLFEINLIPVWLQFVIPSVVPITVNGVQQSVGTILVAAPLGENTLSAPIFVAVNSTTRLRFDHWADGSDEANRTVTVQGNETYEADYVTQYLLTITGAEQNVTGAGWFDSGTNASFAIYPYQTMSGLLGALGAKQTLQGFYENDQLITSQASGTMAMDGPHTLNVVWEIDYSTPAILLTGIIAVITLGLLVAKRLRAGPRRRVRRRPRRRRTSK